MGNSSFFLLILIILVPVGIWWWIKKRKEGPSTGSGSAIKRHDGDEVWRTIKDFLKSNNEKGKDIVESYVAKRPSPDVINRALSKEDQKKQKLEIKARKNEEKRLKNECKKAGKPYIKEKEKELYVVLFSTKNAKTGKVDKPRAIECQVINVNKSGKKSSKNAEKRIITLGEVDYETEAKWILPIKDAEIAKLKKSEQRQQKYDKLNIFKTYKAKRLKAIEADEARYKQYSAKLEAKEAKKQVKKEAKERREKEKWEKKETVVKVKK
ncbi:MAG: DUF5385 family protein [Malacoplasma sp.]|nr:DUF5385 family protein [Malacoplasma sp.]